MPAENIRWPAGWADSGDYWFRVVTYSPCSEVDLSWHLVIRVRGQVVVDDTGFDTSDYYLVEYGLDGTPRVRLVTRGPALERATKG